MERFGFKLYKDSDLNYELVAGDIKVALNSVNQQEQTVTVYFGAWDDYDPVKQKSIRTKLTLAPNDTLLWTLIRLVDNGEGGKKEIPAVEFVKSVRVSAPDEEDLIELKPNNPVANFYYNNSDDNKLSEDGDDIIWGNFNVGEYKHGWSTSTNIEAGFFRAAKRDEDDESKEIIMTRRDVYGDDDDYPDRYMLWSHGDRLPHGWYIKDFWAYTYPNDDNDETKANDIIPRLKTLQSGTGNAIRMDINFYIPENYTGESQDLAFKLKVLGLKNVLVEQLEI